MKRVKKSRAIAAVYGPEAAPRRGLPLYLAKIPAGFPSPADDFIDRKLDLNEHLVKHPAATFFVKVQGSSMTGAGIHSGDILVVDRSLEPADKRIAVVALNGELTVKRLRKAKGRLYLASENPEYRAIEVTPEMNFEVWGVVVHVIHPV
jgi:DNA polymerase V